MRAAREIIKAVAKEFGVYEWTRTRKDLTYRTLRNSKLATRLLAKRLLRKFGDKVPMFINEFENSDLLSYIDLELVKVNNHLHGVSSPLNLRALYVLCRAIKPNSFVETGVAGGASSFVILSALEKNRKGHLYSIDLPPNNWDKDKTSYRKIDHVTLAQDKEPGWIVPDELRARWTLIVGDSKEKLKPLVEQLGEIDVFYHDAEHTYQAMLWEYQTVWPYISTGGVLCSDDVTWNRAFGTFKEQISCCGRAKRWFDFGMIRKVS